MGNQITIEKEYHREYYDNGLIKTEGWKINDQKTDYWFVYYPNGKVAEKGHFLHGKKEGYWYFYSQNNELLKEGHFKNNKAENWWIIYDIASSKTKITKKYQYQNDKKNGFCLLYKNDRLFKAEKYINDEKTGEWTDISSFKRDNPNASL